VQARLRRYEDLASEAEQYQKESKLDSITIPIGPRLGSTVIDTVGLCKGFDGRLLIDDLNISIPPGSIVGIVGA
jgi:ATPase subunit of ABC transporter with duplicated ATPase domains